MSKYSSGKLNQDEVCFIQSASTKVLAAAVKGEVDLNRIAREELAARGMDTNGNWIGFDRAHEQLGTGVVRAARRLAGRQTDNHGAGKD